MDKKEILSKVDHTLLDRAARWEDIKALCDDALSFGTASVCIPPSFVRQTAEYLDGRLAVCTVIGFPNGYNTTAVKCAETREAVENGADEIDMVINIGWLKEGKYGDILGEINAVKAACGVKLLKVDTYLDPASGYTESEEPFGALIGIANDVKINVPAMSKNDGIAKIFGTKVNSEGKIQMSGWCGVNGGVEGYVYSVDGGNTQGKCAEPCSSVLL